MRTLKTLRPGDKGTKELVARYGTSLLCVRYRCDDLTRERVKNRGADRPASGDGNRIGASGAEGHARRRRGFESAVRSRLLRDSEACPFTAALDGPEGRSPDPLGRDRGAPPDQVRRWLVGPEPPALASPPRPSRAPRSPSPGGGRSRSVDVDTAWLDVDTARGGRCGHGVDRSGDRWAALGTACR